MLKSNRVVTLGWMMDEVTEERAKNKLVIIINGKGGVGKDTLCNAACEEFNGLSISSVDRVKDIAEQIGWRGEKDNKARKMLSDLKRLIIEYNDGIMKELMWSYEEFIQHSEYDLMFVHIREPEEIERYKNYIKEKGGRVGTIIVKRNLEGVGTYGNPSDDGVDNYEYDEYFYNNKPIPEATKEFNSLIQRAINGEHYAIK